MAIGEESATFADSWTGYSLVRDSLSTVAPVAIPIAGAGGKPNVAAGHGTVRFWISPFWTSVNERGEGKGPGHSARLLELVNWGGNVPETHWSLYLDEAGDTIYFSGHGANGPTDFLKAPITFQTGEWWLVTVCYSETNSALWLNDQSVATGGGVARLTAEATKTSGVVVGSDIAAMNPAEAQFEEVTTFDYWPAEAQQASYYRAIRRHAMLGPIGTEEEEEAKQAALKMILEEESDGPEDSGGESGGGIPDYGCGLWLEIIASNAIATLTLHNTRSGAGYQIQTNSALTTTNWSLFLTNVADGSGVLTWTNIAIDLSTNLFFRACEARDYVTNLVFQGLSYTNTFRPPPDSMGAVGPNHFVELINNGIAVFDKSGGLVTQTNSTNFFAVFDATGTNSLTGDFMVDPRLLFDSQSSRWVACAIDLNNTKDVVLAVSNSDSPTNLATGWTRYLLPVQRNGPDTDFTTLGLDANGIYIRVLHRWSSTNAGHTIVAIKKPEIYEGTFVATNLYLTNDLDFKLWTVQPTVNFDGVPTNAYMWFVAKGPPDLSTNYQGGEVYYRRLQWIGTNVLWSDTNWRAVSGGNTNYRDYYDLDGTNVTSLPANGVVAEALGGNIDLYKIGSRITMSVIRNGFLWTCHTVGLSGTNGSYSGDKFGTNVDRSAIQWLKFQIGPEGSALTHNDHGRVADSIRSTSAWWYHYPSLMVNCPGDMVAGFSGSSATNYVGAFYTWRSAGGVMLGQPRVIRSGSTNYLAGEWGDYSATTLDPTDDWTFWTVQEYATRLGTIFPHSWATVVAKIRPYPGQ